MATEETTIVAEMQKREVEKEAVVGLSSVEEISAKETEVVLSEAKVKKGRNLTSGVATKPEIRGTLAMLLAPRGQTQKTIIGTKMKELRQIKLC